MLEMVFSDTGNDAARCRKKSNKSQRCVHAKPISKFHQNIPIHDNLQEN